MQPRGKDMTEKQQTLKGWIADEAASSKYLMVHLTNNTRVTINPPLQIEDTFVGGHTFEGSKDRIAVPYSAICSIGGFKPT
jgi:hypothetical protein